MNKWHKYDKYTFRNVFESLKLFFGVFWDNSRNLFRTNKWLRGITYTLFTLETPFYPNAWCSQRLRFGS